MVSNHNLNVALKWAAAGASILVTAPDKKARIKWRDLSTTDAEAIKGWFAEWPDSLPAIDLAKAGIVVLDGDRHGGPDGVAAVERLFAEHELRTDAIPTVVTPQDGRHYWFRQRDDGEPIGNSDKAVRDSGINVRGAGGYVIAPGTLLSDGRRYGRDPATPSTIEAMYHGTIPAMPPAIAAMLRKPKPEATAPKANGGGRPPGTREETYAQAALDGLATEFAGMPPNSGRNIELNNAAMRMGHMIAAGWIGRATVEGRLFDAAMACGLVQEDGKPAVLATMNSGLVAGEKEPHGPLPDRDDYRPANDTTERQSADTAAISRWKFHTGEPAAPPQWLIKNILPRAGAALVAGQWGTFKTTAALDICVAVMTELPFAGRYRIKRRGGVLFIALEGERMLASRLTAIAMHQGIADALPFAWRGDCPPLTDNSAVDTLCKLADEAAHEIKARFGLPIALIVIDTVITAAQHKEGGDNDSAASQRVMSAMAALAKHTDALVVGIDHFGKVIETGTRGSSAKEGAADTVLALLADRELSGGVKNTRLAVRKQRDGVSGFEIPFSVRTVETGRDDDDDPVTAQIIDWQSPQRPDQKADAGWTQALQLLRRVLMTTLAEHAKNAQPFIDGPLVPACDVELVRAEYYRQYPAEGNEEQKQAARRQAFNRHLKQAVQRSVAAVREIEGVQLIWLTKPETAAA